jgi:hypothetical protein
LVQDVISQRFREARDFYNHPERKIIISHVGDVSQDNVSAFASITENQMELFGVSRSAIKKFFNIVVETLQNVRLHAECDANNIQHAFVVIGKNKNEYTIDTCNYIRQDNVDLVRLRLEKIKKLNEAELKKLYMDVLEHGEVSDKGGAGLGFLTIAIKSHNAMDFFFERANEKLYTFRMISKVIG